MSSSIHDLVSTQLRSTEKLTALVEAEYTLAPSDGSIDNLRAPQGNLVRIVAVVIHTDASTNVDEGCILILRAKPRASDKTVVNIVQAYPFTSIFSLNVAQARRPTLNLDAAAQVDQSRSEFTLIIKPDGDSSPAVTLRTRDVTSLQKVISECRRLRQSQQNSKVNSAFSWLSAYTSMQNSLISPLRSVDLRVLNEPLISRLSPATAGMSGDDIADIDIVRQHWIHDRVLSDKNASDYNLRIRVGTFNVNGQIPSQDLSEWLQSHPGKLPPLHPVSPLHFRELDDYMSSSNSLNDPPRKSIDLDPTRVESESIPYADPDLIVVGFQELDLSAGALVYGANNVLEQQWVTAILAGLGEKAEQYEKLASKQLVGLLIIAFVKKSAKPNFSDVSLCAAGAGFLGVAGNKGAVGIRLRFSPPAGVTSEGGTKPITLTFVNAHLAAFDEMVEKRNYDFRELEKRLQFDEPAVAVPDFEATPRTPWKIYESDALFWMGDLNYRLDLPDSEIRELLNANVPTCNSLEMLMEYDQLRNAIKAGSAFVGFREHDIAYFPSYRFSSGILKDKFGYDIKRKPAWTDRILHMTSPYLRTQQLSYFSHPQITFSDHRPVSAEFSLSVPVLSKDRVEEMTQRLQRELWGFEESGKMPKISLGETTSLDFGKVFYRRPIRKYIEIRNDGETPCVFRFVPMDVSQPICPEWLQISTPAGLLCPRETTEVKLTAWVDNKIAAKLNLDPKRIDCTLILHTAMGKDHFISVSAEYQYTCLANKLSRLTRLPAEIRSLERPDALIPGNPLNAPREFIRLMNWMMSNVKDVNLLMTHQVNEEVATSIQESLDTGAAFPETDSDDTKQQLAGAFGLTLPRFLDALPEPVVPPELHMRVAGATSRDEAFEALEEFPPESVNVWISLTAFLHYVVQQAASKAVAEKDLDKEEPPVETVVANNLALVYAPILMPDDPDNKQGRITPLQKRDFLLHFIS